MLTVAPFLRRGNGLQIAITVACLLAQSACGYSQAILSGLVGNSDFQYVFDHPSPSMEGFIISILALGAFTGCLLNMLIADWGPKKSICFSMAFMTLGTSLQISSFSKAQLVVARFITGISLGVVTASAPTYQSELCEAHKRGRLVSLQLFVLCFGISLAYWVAYGFSFFKGPVAWRLPIAFPLALALPIVILMIVLPESPRYLHKHKRNEEALQVLCDLYDLPLYAEKIQIEQEEILQALAAERARGKCCWSQLLKKDELQTRKRVLLVFGVQVMNQLGGVNLVVNYIGSVLQNYIKVSMDTSLLLGGLVNGMLCLGSIAPSLSLDRIGRRWPMIWGSAGLAVSMMMISILLSFHGKSHERATASASIGFFCSFMFIYGASIGTISWVYLPEIMPLHARVKGTAVGASTNWLLNFCIVMSTPALESQLSWKIFLIFMVINAIFMPVVYCFYPETAKLTLEAIDFLFTETTNDNALEADRIPKRGRTREVMRSVARAKIDTGVVVVKQDPYVRSDSSASEDSVEKVYIGSKA